MLVTELQELEEVKSLLTKGQAEGVIAYGEVAKALAEVEVDEGDIEELYGYLEGQGVEMVDDPDPAHAAAPAREPADGKRGRKRKAATLDLKPDMTTDSLAAVPQGHRQGPPADRPGRGRPRQAHRARRPRREAEDGRVQPPPGRLDRQELPQPGPAVPRPDPGGHARPRPRRGEVRLPQGLQVLDLRHLVDPPGDRPRARRQGADDPHPGPRRREAQQDRPRRAQARHRARPRAHRRRRSPTSPASIPRRSTRSSAPRRLRSRWRSRSATRRSPSSASSSPTRRPSRRSSAPPTCSPRRRCARRWRTSPTASAACSSSVTGSAASIPRTLDEVGRTFNVTRERIRQIENQSLKKLQSLAEAQKLREVA